MIKKIVTGFLLLSVLSIAGLGFVWMNSYQGELEILETRKSVVKVSPLKKEIISPKVEIKKIEKIIKEKKALKSRISMEEFSKHNSPKDCWILFENSVYDVTSFLPLHPGGSEKINQFCGNTRFEKTFKTQHGDSKVNALKNNVGKLKGDLG